MNLETKLKQDKFLKPIDFIPLIGIVIYLSRNKESNIKTKQQVANSKLSSAIINIYHTGIIGTIGYLAYRYMVK